MSTEELLAPAGSKGWPSDCGMVDTPKVGSGKVGPVTAEMSREATDGWSNWIGATLGAKLGGLAGVVLRLIA